MTAYDYLELDRMHSIILNNAYTVLNCSRVIDRIIDRHPLQLLPRIHLCLGSRQ